MEQFSLFDYTRPKIHIDNKIRLIELFAGIGATAMALRDIGADFERYRVVEWDKYAIAAYNAIHGTDFKTLDICNVTGEDMGIIHTHIYTYILTWSFPCQAVSLAGKREGMEEGSGTSSSLAFEVMRVLDECKDLSEQDDKYGMPQILLMENVVEVHNAQNLKSFQALQEILEKLGYTNYVVDMNAADYGVAQHRERCFMMSIYGEYNYKFPVEIPLRHVMADYLDDKVDEKFYINEERTQKLIDQLIVNNSIPN